MKTLHLLFAFLTLLLTLAFNAKADTELDRKLDVYVQLFKLKPLAEPPAVESKLFRLGRDLFFEKAISGNKNISCADCHHPRVMTHDSLPLGVGEGSVGLEIKSGGRQQNSGILLARNTPALFNLGTVPSMFWDGRVQFDEASHQFITPVILPEEYVTALDSALSAQALFPMVNHAEMRGQKGTNEIADAADEIEAWKAIYARLKALGYEEKLQAQFPNQAINMGHVARAIGYFESQAFWAGDTAYDRYLKGDKTAMTEVQKIGMDVFFGKGKCGECHQGEHLSDFSFHNIGVPQIGPGNNNGDDFGRGDYAFKVPPLRNVSMTAPYMHNGAFKTLAMVIEHYDDVEGSLGEYVFVNNYKSYSEKIVGPLKETNEAKLALLSTKLNRKLKFEESEEKALAEFIRGALTEKRFLDMEVDEEYITNLRIQLTEEGYQKLKAALPSDAQDRNSSYYYFDVLTPEGYGLRELEKPIKIYFTETEGATKLTYRKQLFKSSGSEKGVIAGGTFESEETLILSQEESEHLSQLNRDFYGRLYTYNTNPIPTMELQVMKEDVLGLNQLWHKLNFKSIITMSDELNTPKNEILFAPTSMNTKEESLWGRDVNGYQAKFILQRSTLRNEFGGIVQTWAVEVVIPKVSKKDLPRAFSEWLKGLTDSGLAAPDAQGTSPSPSKLTEKVLLDIM